MAKKKCKKCGEVKPITEFRDVPRNSDGKANDCRECYNEYQRRYSAEHYDRVTELRKKSEERNHDKRLARRKMYVRRYPLKQAGLLHVTGRCLICGQTGWVRLHHQDYNKPTEVDALCQSCHMRVHAAVRELIQAATDGNQLAIAS